MSNQSPISRNMERAGEPFDGTVNEFFGIVFTEADQIRYEAKLAEIDQNERVADGIGRTIFLRAF